MYAIIETGGKQYKVESGDVITCEKLDVEAGKKVTFDKVLVVGDGDDTKVGTPYIDGMTVEGKVIENGKGKKIIVFKYKAKKDSKTKQGHRQPYTMVEIEKIGGKAGTKASKSADKTKAADKAKPAEKSKAAPKAKTAEKAKAAAPKKAKAEPKKESAKKVSASMKKDDLIAFAKENGIKVDQKAKKQDIIDEINKNLK